jgi:hypothetical protein
MWIGGAFAVLVCGAVTWHWVMRPKEEAPPPPSVAAAPTAPRSDASAMPPTAAADSKVEAVAAGLSSSPGWAQWLKVGDLARRFVSAVNSVADGTNPRAVLSFLAPTKPFRVIHRHRHAFIDPDSYHRYDALTDVIASIDAKAAASAYRTLLPLLDAAYAEIGKPGTKLDGRLAEAFQRIEASAVPTAPLEVEPHGIGWRFARSDFESLPAATKSLLRMGPRNMKIVQSKLQEVANELHLTPLAVKTVEPHHHG